jgi:hypothetical protein
MEAMGMRELIFMNLEGIGITVGKEGTYVLPPAWIPRQDKRTSLSGLIASEIPLVGSPGYSIHPIDPRLMSRQIFQSEVNIH